MSPIIFQVIAMTNRYDFSKPICYTVTEPINAKCRINIDVWLWRMVVVQQILTSEYCNQCCLISILAQTMMNKRY